MDTTNNGGTLLILCLWNSTDYGISCEVGGIFEVRRGSGAMTYRRAWSSEFLLSSWLSLSRPVNWTGFFYSAEPERRARVSQDILVREELMEAAIFHLHYIQAFVPPVRLWSTDFPGIVI